MLKNVTGQLLAVYAHDTISDEPKTGDAGNITAYFSKDGANENVSDDTTPTELDATNMKGVYLFTLTQGETDCDEFIACSESSTAGVLIDTRIINTLPDADTVRTVNTNIGTPANIDGGGATIAGNLKKMADDNDGADFVATQDSLRKLRERGDHAWQTGVGATAANSYTADAITIVVGDADSGDVDSTYVVDGTGMVIGELASGIRMHVTADFTAVVGENPIAVELWAGYSGNGAHHIDVFAYNYTDDSEEKIGEIPDMGGDIEPYTFHLNPAHIDTDASLQIIFRHDPTNQGVASHSFDIDKIIVTTAEDSLMKVNIDAILVDTVEIGAAGVGLTDLGGMSTAMKAEVNAEADTALADINLDHLIKSAVDTDLPTTVADSSVIGHILAVDADVSDYNNGTESLEALRDNQSGGISSGSGAITFTYTLYTNESESTGPIADVAVWVTTDSAGATVVANGTTNSSGAVVFYLDAGTYYFWRQAAGYNFTNPDTETVS